MSRDDIRSRIKSLLSPSAAQAFADVKTKFRETMLWRAYRKSPWIPPPHVVKFRALAELSRRYRTKTLVETGTYMGDMPWKCRHLFRRIYSIELSHQLALKAAERLGSQAHIQVLEGDSTFVLPNVLEQINERALFWLDGHYSSGVTALGPKPTPLAEELLALQNHHVRDHVIVIDDARLLGTEGYPTFSQLRLMLLTINPRYMISVVDDMVRSLPPNSRK